MKLSKEAIERIEDHIEHLRAFGDPEERQLASDIKASLEISRLISNPISAEDLAAQGVAFRDADLPEKNNETD